MLFDRAAEAGADTFDRTRLVDVLFDDAGNAKGVVVKGQDGEQREISCRVVIDGTGQQSFIANKLGLKQVDPDLKKAAVWTYYKGRHARGG